MQALRSAYLVLSNTAPMLASARRPVRNCLICGPASTSESDMSLSNQTVKIAHIHAKRMDLSAW